MMMLYISNIAVLVLTHDKNDYSVLRQNNISISAKEIRELKYDLQIML